MTYTQHLIKNWKVAFHALHDFFAHFIHGLIPAIKIRHHQPDIIRCKDCKWYGRADKRRFYRGMDCLQKRIDTIVPDRDFCSRAERKKNGQ